MRQRAKFWTWRSFCSIGRMLQLGIIGFVVFIVVVALGEVTHTPLLADHSPPHHFLPAANVR